MTMNELLGHLLSAADDVGRSFNYAQIALWPAGAVEVFQKLGLLWRSAGGMYAPCPNCHDHHVEPVSSGFYISCPESLMVKVSPEMCECWEVAPAGLAAAAGRLLGIKAKPQQVIADRFWRLGRTPWPPGSGQTREVVLAMRMHEDDAATVAAHVGTGGRAIVLVPHHLPDGRVWSGTAPAVVPLSLVLSMEGDKLAADAAAVIEIVRAADDRAEKADALALGPTGKRMVRQQVKAEMKGQLEDDVLVAAWQSFGSVRKAADALTEQLGRTITKDKVQNALTRAGGAKALREKADSASVARTVASQRRDRGRKFLERR